MTTRYLVAAALLAAGLIQPQAAGADPAGTAAAPASAQQAPATPTLSQRLEGRDEARIPFSRSIRTFEVKREQGDDILYIQDQRREWYRGEIQCSGVDDPRHAIAIAPIDHSGSFSRFSRIILLAPGEREHNRCNLRSFVKLTADEAIEAGVLRAPRQTAEAATSGGTR
jgi:hypothetical protein